MAALPTYSELVRRREQETLMSTISDIIAFYIRPFHTGDLVIYTNADYYKIEIEISTFKHDKFVMDQHELDYKNDPNELGSFIGTKAGEYFASLREPITTDNIILATE